MTMLKLATVFTGIGAVEHALERLGMEHEIIFACDSGGVDIFKKNVPELLSNIENEVDSLKIHLGKISFPDSCDYIILIESHLSKIEETLIRMRNVSSYTFLDTEKIKITLNIVTEKLSKLFPSEFPAEYQLGEADISVITALVSRVLKYLKKDDYGLKSEKIYLETISSENEYKKIKKDLRELSKKISEIHRTTGTLEILSELNRINNPRAKKDYVDCLYQKKENSNFVRKSYLANYALDKEHFHWNISFLDGNEYNRKVDLLVGGSPCQSFSMAGKRKGFQDTRGTLFYEFVRLLKEIEPRFFIYENVKGVLSHDEGKTWEIMQNAFRETGYSFRHYIFNSKDFGIPQNRNRLFVIGFRNNDDLLRFRDPQKKKLKLVMQDFLEDNPGSNYFLPEKGLRFVTDPKNINKQYTQINGDIALCQKANQQFNWHGDFIESYTEEELNRLLKIDPKYFLSEKIKKYILSEEDSLIAPETDLKIARPLTATMHKMHRAGVDNYITYGWKLPVEKRKIRKLTPRECFRLMGFKDSFKITVSDTQAYHQAGNSIVVDILMSIVNEIINVAGIRK